jgi:ABC-type multidrug transport system fused ATPase/permease subunit
VTGAIAILILMALPQLIYWKIQTGSYVYYSYGKQRFFFNHPHIWKGLFSYRKGWLLYSPVMILSVFGFIWLKRYNKQLLVPVLAFCLINIYIVFSWWCWWYGGSFGQRALIESYAFLSLPMAACITQLGKNRLILSAILLFALGTVYLNIRQTKQYAEGILHWDSMSKELYWATFNKMQHLPEDQKNKLLAPPDYEKAMEGRE